MTASIGGIGETHVDLDAHLYANLQSVHRSIYGLVVC